jgi:hypothetical protein
MMYDYEGGAQHLYGGVERLRANILVSEVAYAEASKRAARDRSIVAARHVARSGRQGGERKSPRAELSVD